MLRVIVLIEMMSILRSNKNLNVSGSQRQNVAIWREHEARWIARMSITRSKKNEQKGE
jgi:hypothetical protein